jgi:hypothetical protein
VPKLTWEFHGPDARRTAEHYLKHLDGFLGVNGLAGCTIRVETAPDGRSDVVCESPPEWADAIEKALRPRRRTD